MEENLEKKVDSPEDGPMSIGFWDRPFGKFFIGYGLCRMAFGVMDYAVNQGDRESMEQSHA